MINITLSSTAQKIEWKSLSNEISQETKIKLIQSNEDYSTFKLTINSIGLKKVLTPKGEANIVEIPEGSRIEKLGAPDLPKLTQSIVISDYNEMKFDVLSSQFKEIENIEIAPSKGIMKRDKSPSDYPYVYGEEYITNKFFPDKLIKLRDPYIIRNVRGQTIVINPVQYNPVTKKLRIYNEIIIKVYSSGKKGINTLSGKTIIEETSNLFNKIYENHFLNYKESKYTPLSENGDKMLIICDNEFINSMQPYVCLKNLIGLQTEIIDYSTIGNSSALKTYITDYYNNQGLTFLLLVGDHSNIPVSSTSAGDSDNNYGYIVGNDHYIDIIVGRFSAENINQVETMVERTIFYEKDINAIATWFKNGIGIASDECCGDDGESDEQHMDNIEDDLQAYGYTINDCYESGGTTSQLTSYLNSGSGIINYVGHGNITCWSSLGYCSSNVNSLQNVNKLPFIFSVACQNGNFKNNTCFAETWLRATYDGHPTGAVAFCGATINQSWSSPMCAQDEMIDLIVSNEMGTYGGVFVNGLFQMIDEYGTDGENMADTWVCFGDPSLKLRTPGHQEGPINMPITGPSPVCTSNSTFTLSNVPDGATVDWNCSDNMEIVTEETSYCNAHALNSSINGSGTITATISLTGCDPITVEKEVWVGNPKLYRFDEDGYKISSGEVLTVEPGTVVTFEAYSYDNSVSIDWEVLPSTAYYVNNGHECTVMASATDFITATAKATNICGEYYMLNTLRGLTGGGGFLLNVSPNPTTFETEVELIRTDELPIDDNTEWEIEVYNLGMKLKSKSQRIHGNKHKIDVSSWKKGVYVIRAYINEEVITKKFIKE